MAKNSSIHSAVMGLLFNPTRERGCTKDQFKEALDIVSERLKNTVK